MSEINYETLYGSPYKTDFNGTKYYYDWNCSHCNGTGTAHGYICIHCNGTGKRETPITVKQYVTNEEQQKKTRTYKRRINSSSQI